MKGLFLSKYRTILASDVSTCEFFNSLISISAQKTSSISQAPIVYEGEDSIILKYSDWLWSSTHLDVMRNLLEHYTTSTKYPDTAWLTVRRCKQRVYIEAQQTETQTQTGGHPWVCARAGPWGQANMFRNGKRKEHVTSWGINQHQEAKLKIIICISE